MTLEVALYILGASLIPIVGFGIRINYMVKKLVDMHNDPDRYGFGTIALSTVIANNSKAMVRVADCMEDMDLVLRWMAKENNSGDPPPRMRRAG